MIVFTTIGMMVVGLAVLIVLLCIIPQSFFCRLGFHESNGCYSISDKSHEMITTCRCCKKEYNKNLRW